MGLWSLLFGNPAASKQAKEWVSQGAVLLDVRTTDEYAGGHLPGAKNIPVQVLGSKLKQLGKKGSKVVVYCRSGSRSAAAKHVLTAAGYEVCDLGPMSAW